MIIDFPETYDKVGPALVRTGNWDPKKTFITDGLVTGKLAGLVGAEATEGLRGTAPGTPEKGAPSEAFNALYEKSSPKNVERGTFDSQNFDAVILCYLAAVAAGSTEGEAMKDELKDITGPPGTKYTWQQLPDAIKALQDGKDIDYNGAAGEINLDDNGDPTEGVYDIVELKNGEFGTIKQVPPRRHRPQPRGRPASSQQRPKLSRARGPGPGSGRSICSTRAAQVELRDLRVVEQFLAPPLEAFLAEVEHIAAVGERERPPRVLLDHHDRDARAVDLGDLLEDRVDERRREPGRGLVEQQYLRVRHQRSRHRDHLPFAAAHRAGGLRSALAETRKELVHAGDALAGRRAVEGAHLEVLLDGEGGKHVVELRHVAEPLARDRVRLRSGEVVARNRTRPWRGFSRPKIVLISVDLPAPFGPITVTISPSATRIETPLRMSTSGT